MNGFGLRFHHLGLAVKDPAPARAFVLGMGYRVSEPIFDPLQEVNLLMCEHEQEPAIEIIYPVAGRKSPVEGLLARRPAGLVYHACYVCADLTATLDALKAAGLRTLCVAPSKPAVLFGGTPVSFYQVMGMGLIEIIEGEPRPLI